MSDAADIFGQPVSDPEQAHDSFHAGGSGTFSGGDIGGAGLRFLGPHQPTPPLTSEDQQKLVDLIRHYRRHDCSFVYGHCQLSRGHALPHCVPDPDGSGSYLMVDDDGRILREI